MNREQWLTEYCERLRPEFENAGVWPYPQKWAISCSWPARGALATRKRTIGQCWAPETCADGTTQLFISPCLADIVEVGETIVHELGHAIVGVEHGHKKPFKTAALRIGLEGKMTATKAGDALAERLQEIGEAI